MAYNIIAAIGLVLLIEGILPFLAPRFWRMFVLQFSVQSDRILRITGLFSMLVGLLILVLLRRYG
jgi:uncharacterized protein